MDSNTALIKPMLSNAAHVNEKNTLTLKNLSIDIRKRTVKVDDTDIKLTKTEYELLKYLVTNKGITFTREQLMTEVWGYNYLGETNVVDVYIRYLRAKLDDRFNVKFIYTVRRVGYLVKE